MNAGKPYFGERKPRKDWKPSWCVWLEWIGNKPQVLPLIEYAVRENSDGSGVCLLDGVCDASWGCDKVWKARRIFIRLRTLCASTRFSPFIKLRLMHFAKPETRAVTLDVFRRGKEPNVKELLDRVGRKPRKRRAA